MIDFLTGHHREVDQLFQQIEDPSTDAARRGQLVNVAIAELVRHSVAEEQHVYPATRQALPDGDQVADKEIEDHSEAEEIMKQLERTSPTDDAYLGLAMSLISVIRGHISDEEGSLFPRLRQACTQEQLTDLGVKVKRTMERAPTRPHPMAPDKPPANKLLAPGAGMVDRLRDAFSNRPTTPEDL